MIKVRITDFIKKVGWLAFANPLLNGLEKSISSLNEEIAELDKLEEVEKTIILEEEEIHKRVCKLQAEVLQKAKLVKASEEKLLQTLLAETEHKELLHKIDTLANNFKADVQVHFSELDDDMATLKRSLETLKKENAAVDPNLRSFKKLKSKR